jgi:hypothetical protein
MRISRQNLPSLFAKIIPYASFLVVVLAFGLTVILFRLDSAVRWLLILGIPAILASVIAIRKFDLLKRSPSTVSSSFRLNSRSFLHLVLLFITLYLFSLCFLVQEGARPVAYFCFVALMAGVIFIEILSTEKMQGKRHGIILIQIAFLATNLIFGQTLKLPLYFAGGDVLHHMGWINSIIESGHVTSAMAGYQFFPLFHIFGASGVLVTGMQFQTSYFVLNGLSFVIFIPIVYLLVKQVTKDTRLALLATLIYCLSREVIFNGMYMNTREMAFLFYLLVLYLLIQRNWRLRIIAVSLILPFVLLHQTTLVYVTGILVLIMIIEFILYGRSQYIGYNFPMLFTIAYVGYWLYLCYPFFLDVINMISSSEVVAVPVVAQVIGEPIFSTLAKSADYSILFFFALVGIVSQLYQDDEGTTMSHVFALFAFVTLPFFIPDIVYMLSPMFLAYRLPLLISPFIALAMAAGVLALTPRLNIKRQRLKSTALFGPILLLTLLYSFFSMFLLGGQTDQDWSALGEMGPRRYFTQAELTSFSFLTENKGYIPIYTDSHSSYYLEGCLSTQANGTVDTLDAEMVREGYMLFRKEEFELRGILLFQPTDVAAIYADPHEYRTGDIPDLETTWQVENKIFNNGAVQIYLK